MIKKIVDNEISDSINDAFKKRLTTPVYGTFIVSWLLFHWKFIFTIFLVNEDFIWRATGLLKNDYLSKIFFDFKDLNFYFFEILPFIFTWFIIWKLPNKILLPAFEKDQQYEVKKKIIKISQQRKLEEELIKLEMENVKKIDVVSEKTEKEQKLNQLDPTILWLKEFEEFKSSLFYDQFDHIIQSLYQHNGRVEDGYENNAPDFIIPKDMLAYAHTSDLIIFKSTNVAFIELTEKGKYFVKKYMEDKSKIF